MNKFLLGSLLLIVLNFAVGLAVRAEINPLQYKVLNFNQFKMAQEVRTPEKLDQYIPLTLKPSSDQNAVMAQVADRSIQTWLNSPLIQSSPIVGAAATVQSKMKTEVALPAEMGKTQHKFSFEYLLAQATAQMKYSGWLKAVFKYETPSNSANLELTEKVYKNKDLFVSHTMTSIESRSTLGVKWNW